MSETPAKTVRAYVGLGSNLRDREGKVKRALKALETLRARGA